MWVVEFITLFIGKIVLKYFSGNYKKVQVTLVVFKIEGFSFKFLYYLEESIKYFLLVQIGYFLLKCAGK